MKTIAKVFLLLGVVFIAGSSSARQYVPAVPATPQIPVYRPGDMIRVAVTFDGPDADKIIQVRGYMKTDSPAKPKEQPNFNQDENTSSGKRLGPDSFEIDFPIDTNQASGDYRLVEVSATLQVHGQGTVAYSYPQPATLVFKIDNPNTVVQPQLKSITPLPKS